MTNAVTRSVSDEPKDEDVWDQAEENAYFARVCNGRRDPRDGTEIPHSHLCEQSTTSTETQSRGCPHEHAVLWTGAPHSR